jgi:serine/threonine protein kinase
MIGQTLDGRYKIIQELGHGGFGETFVAIDIKLHDSLCVVKKLKPFSNDRETLKLANRLFKLESKTLLRLDHNQIPRLLAHFEHNKNFFLVQELVQGHPLNEEIRVGEQWEVDTMVHFLISALKPLAHAHTKSVIHRDIKPANLMRRHIDGEIVLIDFGAVKEVINSSRHGQAQAVNTIPIGTPGYMPNEQSRCQPKFSSDIYALGVTCIEALTGRSATELEEDPQTFEISWRHLVNIDLRLADILDRMVCYDFRQRYSSGGEALSALQTYINSLPFPISSPRSSYLPQNKFVNTYLDDLEIKFTKKISVATKVSHFLDFSITAIAGIYLFLQRQLNIILPINNLIMRSRIWRDVFCIYSLYIGLPLGAVVVAWQSYYWFWKFFSGVSLFISVPIGFVATILIIFNLSENLLSIYVNRLKTILNRRFKNNLRYLFLKPFLEEDISVYLMYFLACPLFSWVSIWGLLSLVFAGKFLWINGLYILAFYYGLNILGGEFPEFSSNEKDLLWKIGNGSSFFLANFTVWNIGSKLFSLKIVDNVQGNPFASTSISQWLLLTVAQFISYITIRSLIASLLIDLPAKRQPTIFRPEK